MFKRRERVKTPTNKVVKFTGGLNEQVSNLELSAGELIDCKNYIDIDGKYHGYESVKGYERFDGQTLASDIPSVSWTLTSYGDWEDVRYFEDTALWNDGPSSTEEFDDLAREAQRALIDPVPGYLSSPITGVHIYQDRVYAVRDKDPTIPPPTEAGLYVESPASWVEVTGTNMNAGGTCRFVNYRFSEYEQNAEVMIWVDEVSQPHIYNGTTVTELDMTSTVGAGVYPTRVGVWKNRLFLVYPNGHILFSEVGNPLGWDAAIGLAGEIYVGDEVTNIVEAPGGVLVITTRESIKVLYYGSTGTDFVFKLDEFSNSTGALPDTLRNLLGTLYLTDDQGFTSLEAIENYGDFSAKDIGKNVRKTYQAHRQSMGWSVVDKDTNRYFQFYTDNVTGKTSGLVFTFKGKSFKGATRIELIDTINTVASGSINGVNSIFLGDAVNGYVYKFQSGTSFDGTEIDTYFTSSYYHYTTPRNWKTFKRIAFEIEADTNAVFTIHTDYDYGTSTMPTARYDVPEIQGSGSTWGGGVWGTFVYGGSILDVGAVHNTGMGTNMSVRVATNEKFRSSHKVYNMITDYTVNNRQF